MVLAYRGPVGGKDLSIHDERDRFGEEGLQPARERTATASM
jgi:hypothetical protein